MHIFHFSWCILSQIYYAETKNAGLHSISFQSLLLPTLEHWPSARLLAIAPLLHMREQYYF